MALPLAAEVLFNQSPPHVIVLIEDRMGALQSLPTDSTSVAVVLTDGSRWELAADPLPEDPAGRSSRFRTALDAWPASLRDGGSPEGRVELTLREMSAVGRLHAAFPGTPDPEQIESSTFALLGTWCVMIVLASLAGGWVANWMEFSHTRMQLMISLVGGLMLGISLLHLLPHATGELGSIDQAVGWMMAGLVAMFLLIRTFHFHQHGPVELPREAGTVIATPCPETPGTGDQSSQTSDPVSSTAAEDHEHNHVHGAGASCGHSDHRHHHHHGHEESGHAHRLSWIGIAAGLSLHTFIDGLALAASVQADAAHGAVWGLFGVGTFLAILLHKPLDAVSITSLMAAGGWSARARQTVNASFSLMCPLGAACFILGLERFSGQQREILGAVLAFSAGVFACISLGDLLPEMEFHSHNRIPLSLALLTGIAIAWAISLLEPGHAHDHPDPVPAVGQFLPPIK